MLSLYFVVITDNACIYIGSFFCTDFSGRRIIVSTISQRLEIGVPDQQVRRVKVLFD
jgi:hypothetical protein